MGYRIGLDIGITSVGWSVIENDINGNPVRIIDLGSRIFDAAEKPKDGSPLAKERRDARSLRRRLRRKKHRVERTKRLLERYNIITKKEIENMYENTNYQYNVYELRVQGLEEKLTNKELARVLISFVKKRGYKSNSKSEEISNKEQGSLLTATRENENLMKEKGYRTVAEMYLKDDKFKLRSKSGEYLLDKSGDYLIKIKNSVNEYKNTTLRKLLVEEIKLILNKQQQLNQIITNEFISEYLEIFEGQRNFDDGPGGNSPFGGNQIEKMLGICTFESGEKRAAKATYTFEYFKLLQTLNHIKIEKIIINDDGSKNKEKRSLTAEEKLKIKNLLLSKTTVNFDNIRKELGLSNFERFNMLTYKSTIDFSDEANKEIEKDKKLKEFESYNKIKTALNHVEKNYISKLTTDELDAIGYCLTVYKNDEKRIEYLKSNTNNLTQEAIDELLTLTFSKVGHLSIKAMKKIIPELENGLTYDKAVDNVYEDFRGKINTEKRTKLRLKDLEQEITNPVVRRGISQSIKVLNAITLKYNEKYGKPDVVVIELAREMGKNFQDRNNILKEQDKNMARNEKAMEEIKALGKIKPTGQDIVKYKLWQEQDNRCIYSGKNISIEQLFTEAVDVDHIIPYSMCFDDSYANKVLVLASENRQKGNRVPYKYLKESGRNLEEYEIRVNNIIKNPRKKQKLLREDFTREDAKEWKERNLNDTQYITKLMHNLVKNYFEFSDNEKFKRKVWTVNGAITAHIRKRLGIEKTRDGDIHHAIDATVIAITTQEMINKLTKYYQYKDGKFMNNKGEYIDLETGEILDAKEYEEKNGIYFPEPWDKFRKELEIRVNCTSKERMIECLNAEKIFTYNSYEDLEPIFVSRMPRRKVTGEANEATIKGFKEEDNKLKVITKTELTKLKLKNGEIEGYPESCKISDKLLYEALKERLIEYRGNAEEAFKGDFYKPKSDGTKGPVVKKVKIEAKVTLGVKINKDKGFADNGDCVRLDVFYVENEGYYFIPIYVSDTVKNELPNKACVANKSYSEWKEMKDEDFIFSLYPKDLVYIKGKNKIKLNSTNKTDKQQEVEEVFAYYVKAGISVAQITIQTHDNKFMQPSLGIKSLQKFEKYEVDILGNYHKVKLPEKRLPFNIKK
ncbi:MAG: type II CRISPR RNA-guided endonuclease Cas9 [Clostridia bacterium]|nr:type II CRISPR RNA-guided endonuclease Cas9 [Clostridia bacterium]